VWEPILPTDVSKPISIVLSRLSDHRVTQFWDEGHILAARMAQDARPPQPLPNCCVQHHNLWDLVAIYSASALWEMQMPAAALFNGPVLYVDSQIRQALNVKKE
jgi:hypothetical protein